MERESFQSRLGYILVCAGCAIGIGNVWRFPFVTGENGGGIFVLLYLFFLLAMGVPILTMELAVGRASRKSAHKGFEALEPAGSKWHMHGWAALAGNAILMMFYTTVSGWMCAYFYKFMTGKFAPGMTRDELDGVFGALCGFVGLVFLRFCVVHIYPVSICLVNAAPGKGKLSVSGFYIYAQRCGESIFRALLGGLFRAALSGGICHNIGNVFILGDGHCGEGFIVYLYLICLAVLQILYLNIAGGNVLAENGFARLVGHVYGENILVPRKVIRIFPADKKLAVLYQKCYILCRTVIGILAHIRFNGEFA